jgi:hypothetical protein
LILLRGLENVVLSLKVDYEKAYDSIDWDYLLFMLRKFGFFERWVNWMKACDCGDIYLSLLMEVQLKKWK